MAFLLRRFFALHVSVAYLGMLTGLGMLAFSFAFFNLLIYGSDLPVYLHWAITYLLFVIGPGAIILSLIFYRKIKSKTSSGNYSHY